jgi:histidinol-phosphatase (PHP family)
MTSLIDYHVHTDNSFDCKIPMEQMCARAVEIGVTEIAFTDHFNNHILDIDIGYYNADRFFADIERCRAKFPRLTIRAGVEVGEPHRWTKRIRRVVENYPYDVVLGSLHWVGNDNMFNPNYFRARTPKIAFETYFKELEQMIRHGGFDILAHVDVCKRTGYDVYGSFDIRQYEDLIRAIWQACLDQNIIPEINTKGVRCAVSQLHPTLDALRWYAQMGGTRLTIGSDAHHFDNIATYAGIAKHTALEAGITQICRFERRKIVDETPIMI